MNSDCLTVAFSFLDWREAIQQCSTVSKNWSEALFFLQRFWKSRMSRLYESVMLATNDRISNEVLALRWLNEKVRHNYWFGKEPEPIQGCLCDVADFQSSYCMATIIGWKKRTIVYPPLARCMVTHAQNAIRNGMRPESSARMKIEMQYLVRFLGWSDRWNEWKGRRALFPLGSKTMRYVDGEWRARSTQQWILRKEARSGIWQLCMFSRFSDPPSGSVPLTDVTASLLISRKLPHNRL